MKYHEYIELNKDVLAQLLTSNVLKCVPYGKTYSELRMAILNEQNVIDALLKLDDIALHEFCGKLLDNHQYVAVDCFFKHVNIYVDECKNKAVECDEQNTKRITNYDQVIYYMDIRRLLYPLYKQRAISYIDFINLQDICSNKDIAKRYLLDIIVKDGNKEQYNRFIEVIERYQPLLLDWLEK